MRNAFLATVALATVLLPAVASAGTGTISVEVRDEFGNLIPSGSKLEYGCGSGFRTVQDGSADDRDSRSGYVEVIPDPALLCADGKAVSVRVYGLTGVGYIDWSSSAQYASASANAFSAYLPFTLVVPLKDEFNGLVQNATSVVATFVNSTVTVSGKLSPEKSRLGFPVPMGTANGTLTVGGLGSLGFVRTVLEDVQIPKDSTSLQSSANARLQFSVYAIGRDELAGDLQGSGGSAVWNGASQVECHGDGGRAWGCPVPLGSAAGTVTVSRPGYADYRTSAISPPSSESSGRTTVQSANPFTIRVLGMADWRGASLATSATTTLPAGPFLATTEILDARRRGDEWLVAAVPHGYRVQLTVQVWGYQNTATYVDLSSTGQATVDFDDDSITPHWSATYDGPPIYPDLKVTVLSATGAPAQGSTVRVYSTSTYSDSYVADDLVGSGIRDAAKTTDSSGVARFAMASAPYWLRVTRSGDNAVFEKALAYVESGAAYNVTIGGESASEGPGTQPSSAVSKARSEIAAEPLSIPADGESTLTVNVDVRDDFGNPLQARKVELTHDRGAAETVSPASAWTDANGRVTFTMKSATPGSSQVGALIDGSSLGKSVTVTFLTPGSAASTIAPGTIIKLPNDHDDSTAVDTTVYYVAGNGKRYFFPNEKIYMSWYGSYAGLRIVDAATMASIPLGGVVRYRPGARLVKVMTTPDVYAVSRGAVLRPIASEAVARATYGDAWSAKVDDLPDVFLSHYTVGNAVAGSGDYSASSELERTPTIESDLGL